MTTRIQATNIEAGSITADKLEANVQTAVNSVISGTVGGGVTEYATAIELPMSGNSNGDLAFVVENTRLYVWAISNWFTISVGNDAPVITVGADASYTLDYSGTPTIISLTAVDPEGLAITWSYELTSGLLGGTTVEQNANVFTITPSTVTSDAGTFSLTFKATDGVNITSDTAQFTLSFPVGLSYGWFSGGSSFTTVDRIDYANDAVTASIRGSLNATRYRPASAGNADYGWFVSGNYSPAALTSVERITYASDGVTASYRGPITTGRYSSAGTGNTNYGWIGGGGAPSAVSTVDRIDYAADTGTAAIRGPLSLARFDPAATGNANYGWWAGTYPTGTRVDRIDYAADTGTASVRGPTSASGYGAAATGNDNYGWFGGGHGGQTSKVFRITYAADTVVTSTRGPLAHTTNRIGATGNPDFGWWGGGFPGKSTVSRIDYANDLSTASLSGTLSIGRYTHAATGGYPG